jgi:integrase/recombinase XerD
MKQLPIPIIRYLKNQAEPPMVSEKGEIDRYLESSPRAKNTQKSYRQDLEEFQKWLELPLTEAKKEQITTYQQYLGGRDRKLKSSSINRKISVLKGFYGWMQQEGHIDRDPAEALKYQPVSREK